MDGVIYSDTTSDKTVDFIELLLGTEEVQCRHIYVWTSEAILKELGDGWETNVKIYSSPTVVSIGDCLRELYTRDESRDNLIVIGNTDVPITKLSLVKQLGKKHVAVLLLGQGNVSIDLKGGMINRYQWEPFEGSKTGRILEIAYCTCIILSIFQDNFDCNTFHDLILSNPVGYSFGGVMDKRFSLFDNMIKETVEPRGFEEELKEIWDTVTDKDAKRVELAALRMAYGLTNSQLQLRLDEMCP